MNEAVVRRTQPVASSLLDAGLTAPRVRTE